MAFPPPGGHHGLPLMTGGPAHFEQQHDLMDTGEPGVAGYSQQWSQPDTSTSPAGQPKKRPGPKRDSKPAVSEKLERNRQAQRSHRERKELYMKELEAEVQRLKDRFVEACRERDRFAEECNRLARENQRLLGHVYSPDRVLSPGDGYSVSDVTRNSSFSAAVSHGSTPSAFTGQSEGTPSLGPGSSEPPRENMMHHYGNGGFTSDAASQRASSQVKVEPSNHDISSVGPSSLVYDHLPNQQQAVSNNIDYDDVGLDIILALERPCMSHGQYLMVRAHNKESQDPSTGNALPIPEEVPKDDENHHISGHALMASVPTHNHIMTKPNEMMDMQYPNIQRKDLLKLLGLSDQLNLNDAELPPVKAWQRILQNPRLREFDIHDFADLKEKLKQRVHCYRFGAVVTEDDIIDAVESVLRGKSSPSND